MSGLDQETARVFRLQAEYKWTAKRSPLEERKGRLRQMRAEILNRADDVQAALAADLGKPPGASYAPEVESMIKAIDEAVDNLDGWAQPSTFEPSIGLEGSEPMVQYEARGVCLIFGPWNFPFQLLLEPLVPALAAGNTAIMKPNELAPTVSAVSAEIIRAVFDEREVAVFEGGVDLADTLLRLPVDHIFFTGSPAVGRIVMAAAAQHLATVTLELGGKCPAIIDGTHDLGESARLVAFGRHLNGGQACLVPDHAWVREEVRDEFLDHYNQWIDDNLYRDGELNPAATSHIVDERNLTRVLSYIDDARDRGAHILRGGHRASTAPKMIEPTIVLDSPLDSQLMTEEIFGPVLPVATFRHSAEVIDYLRHRPKPLAMYIFSDSPGFVDDVLAATSSGGVTVNGFATHVTETCLPFGGVNHSGTGRYHGIHGFREFSHERAIVRHPSPPNGSQHQGSRDVPA